MSKGSEQKSSRWKENGDWKHSNDSTNEDLLGTNRDHVHFYNNSATGERQAHKKHGASYSEKSWISWIWKFNPKCNGLE